MSQLSKHAQSHIDSIAKQEIKALETRTPTDRAGDAVASFAGSLAFVLLHAVVVLVWILTNALGLQGASRFDPYPFSLLGTIVAIEAVILSSFILMRQNRMTKRAERRDHLNLQIDLIAEKEVTKLLQMVRAICVHLELEQVLEDEDLQEFSESTSVDKLTETIEDTLPKE